MVKDVKELCSDSKVSALPMRDLKHLGNPEVGIEEPRTGELVSSLIAEGIYSGTEVRGKQAGGGRIGSLTSTDVASAQNLRWN